VTGRLDGKIAVVTGASSGIGRAVAERFVAEGAKVLGVGRSATKLEKLRTDLGGGEDIAVHAADLSEDEGSRLVMEAA
jgi:meso-butanediol dehydrogenase/(S,S)-butanediol dehydrogenase/diacetyl reductase